MTNEQKKLLQLEQTGLSIMVEKNGAVFFKSSDSMLKPLYHCLVTYPEQMNGALVIDKIVGRAAAFLCILGGVHKIITPLASQAAKTVLDEQGISLYASNYIPYIVNRDKTGMCPMEKMAMESASSIDFYERFKSVIMTTK